MQMCLASVGIHWLADHCVSSRMLVQFLSYFFLFNKCVQFQREVLCNQIDFQMNLTLDAGFPASLSRITFTNYLLSRFIHDCQANKSPLTTFFSSSSFLKPIIKQTGREMIKKYLLYLKHENQMISSQLHPAHTLSLSSFTFPIKDHSLSKLILINTFFLFMIIRSCCRSFGECREKQDEIKCHLNQLIQGNHCQLVKF